MKTIDFNTISLFPTVIGSCENVPLSEKVLRYANEVLSDPQNLTNAWNYKNTYSKELSRTSVYDEVESFILDVSKSFCDTLQIKQVPNKVQLFFSEMNYGDHHEYHSHAGAYFSGVFYLNVPENSSNIRFHDPRPYTNFINYESKHPATSPIYEIKPQAGLFLIWQSWLPHEVLKNFTENRKTVVFNIGL